MFRSLYSQAYRLTQGTMMGKTGEIQLSVSKTNASDFHFLNSLKSLLHLKAHSLDKFVLKPFGKGALY